MLVLVCAYRRRPAADRLVFSRHAGGHLCLRGGRAGCGASRQLAAAAGLGLFAAYVTNFFAGKYGWYRLLLAFGLREPLENAQRRLTKIRPERDLHHLLAGQPCVLHLHRRRHPAVSLRALRGALVPRGGVLDQLLGDVDLLSRQGRAVACGLPHHPVRDPDLDRGAADLALEVRNRAAAE